MEKLMTNDEYFKSLSEADWDKAEAVESAVEKLLSEGLPEDVAVKFVRTVVKIRTTVPDATVAGIFDTALSAGLSFVGNDATIARMSGKPTSRGSSKRKIRAKLSGEGL